MSDVISIIIGALGGFVLYLLFELFKLRKELKKSKKIFRELEKEYNLEINDLRRKLKDI